MTEPDKSVAQAREAVRKARRAAQEATALRANLQRRKQQARGRDAAVAPAAPAQEPQKCR